MTAFLSISALDGAVVKGVHGLDTDFTGKPIVAIVKVPANAHIERTVVIEQENTHTDATNVDALDVDTLTQLAQQVSLPAASRATLQEGVKILKAKQAITEHKERLDQQVSQLEETIGRLPMSDSSQPASGSIAARFLQLESQRSELQKQSAALEKSIEQQTTVLKKVLGKLPQK